VPPPDTLRFDWAPVTVPADVLRDESAPLQPHEDVTMNIERTGSKYCTGTTNKTISSLSQTKRSGKVDDGKVDDGKVDDS